MDLQTLTSFFMWCTILSCGLMALWASIFTLAPGLVYRMQSRWFPLSREAFDTFFYGFLGMFKIFVIIFNAVPWVALLIVG